MPTYRTTKFAAAVLALPLLIAAFAGCTSTAAPSGGGTASASSSASSSPGSLEDYELAWAQCMRDEGVDMPDPGTTSGMSSGFEATPEFVAAMETCNAELGAPPAAPDGGPVMSDDEQHERALSAAACLRENGIDVPDPEPGEGFESMTLPIDPASKEIVQECLGVSVPGGN